MSIFNFGPLVAKLQANTDAIADLTAQLAALQPGSGVTADELNAAIQSLKDELANDAATLPTS